MFLLWPGQVLKPFEAGGLFLELLDPLIKERECEFLFVSFGGEAVVDDDGAKVAPFWYKGG